MKNTISKIALAVGSAILVSASVNAQGSIGTDFGVMKQIGKDVDRKAMPGFNLSLKHKVNDHVKIGGNVGIYQTAQEVEGVKWRTFIVPITALFEYHFSTGSFSPYLGTDLGVYRTGFKMDGEKAEGESHFGFAPVAGIDYAINEKFSVNANSKLHLLKIKDEKKPDSFLHLI